MKQNTHKNKTKQSVVWSTSSYFTIADLWKLNPDFREITLRVRFDKEIKNGHFMEIGNVPSTHGRPPKVYAKSPATQTTLNKAKASGVILLDGLDNKLVNVMNINNNNKSSTSSLPTVLINNITAPNDTANTMK